MYSARGADDPGETDEEDHTEDVLDARQVDADEGAHARWRRRLGRVRVGRGRRRDRVGVVCQGAEESRRSRPVLQFFLQAEGINLSIEKR